MKEKSLYIVHVYFLAHSFLGTIDVGYQGDVPPELVAEYEIVAVSPKQAVNFARYRFIHRDEGCHGYPLDHFRFEVMEVRK